YKGMLLPRQLPNFYLDLKDDTAASAIALVHSRFSTNTFPSWERAHPMHHVIHNGEINTIRGNVNWVKAREAMLRSDLFPFPLNRIYPVINEDGSDSAMLDEFLSLMVQAAYSFPEAMMMTIPEPWENSEHMDSAKRAFYEYNSCLLEAWDGPAAVAFTDGRVAGATLDRNGLRPSRYYLLRDGTLILASEVGVLPVAPEEIVKKDRLRPGRMLLIDTVQQRIIEDEELKQLAAASRPYQDWLRENLLYLDDLPEENTPGETWQDLLNKKMARETGDIYEKLMEKYVIHKDLSLVKKGLKTSALTLTQEMKMFGYTWEDIQLTFTGIISNKEDPIAAMGTDTPLAVLSNRPQLLYNYFKQLFAQVTNPPIDAIREKIVTSSRVQFGSEGNLLEPGPSNCHMIQHHTPILTDSELNKLSGIRREGFRSITLPILFPANEKNGLKKALEDLFYAADVAMDSGYNIIILSDQEAGETKIPIPALLATSGLHHHLVSKGTRTKVSLVVETAEAREVHHFALLVSYGANGVNPYLAYRIIEYMVSENILSLDAETAKSYYRDTLTKSIVKIMSKMGISTVRSYHGAQIFEALGIGNEVIGQYFTGTTSRIGGVTLKEIEEETRKRHHQAFDPLCKEDPLDEGGDYKWRKNGEYHLLNPENIYYLQQACQTGNYRLFKQFSKNINKQENQLKNIRGLLDIIETAKPIPIDSVEPVENIVKRFKTGAMSYGSISQEAHECMCIAMNRLQGKSNTGEGGELPERFIIGADGNNRSSAIKQVASGRFGVTVHYLNNGEEIQIKMAQGAKPGEGGHLPGNKVYPWVAKSRYSTPGVELISPPPHHDIYSIEDLAQLISDLKSANPQAKISVKLVSEAGVGTIAVGVAKGLADVIVISGYDGGTGAAARTSIRHAGLPWELGVAEAHQSLLMNNLRDRVVLETDGKLMTGRDIIVAALLGAEEFAFATAPLIAMGCNMMRVCNLDTCPVGIATQHPDLRKKFAGKPEYVENLMRFIAQETREWMARIGVRNFNELVGHVEFLKQTTAAMNDKAKTVDLSDLLYQPKVVDDVQKRYFTKKQQHPLAQRLDINTLVPLCQKAINEKKPVSYSLPINNADRTVGASLSSAIVRANGAEGLPDDTIHLYFEGSAGQSFGAFLASGVTMELRGDSNDHVGKGLSGGRLIIKPPKGITYDPAENIIIGNVAFYGATSGEAFIHGIAGERFCVRNSGVTTVVEGVGDHGCEYMTGGKVVVLGKTGRNFAAGMSGGVAYIWDKDATFSMFCNKELVTIDELERQDVDLVREMLEKHWEYTGSQRARLVLDNFREEKENFVKVIPKVYKQVLQSMYEAKKRKLSPDEQSLFAFNEVTHRLPSVVGK
ncbi:MAG: glutamate synthase large subunit, partial [Syntrophomonadaceae bacterium]|nr:glutamate synthase large subunit [Syntrophomonadaceae bacterium]